MSVKKGQIIDLETVDLAFGGRGIAKVDGLVVFIDQAIPGDLVTARIIRKKKSHAVARIEQIISPSPFRIAAPCRFSGYCGGCKWQFLEYDKQLEYKRQHVIDAIQRIGGIGDTPVNEPVPSDQIYGYRNKMEFSCSDRPWSLPQDFQPDTPVDGIALGLHVPGTYHKVIDIDRCLLQPDLGNRILDTVRQFIKRSGVPVYGLRSHQGFWRFGVLRHSRGYDQWLVNIVTAAEDRKLLQPLAEELMETYPEICGVVNNITARRAGVAVGEYEILLSGKAVLQERIGDYIFDISANSFFQTNTAGAEKLYGIVEDFAGLSGKESVLDLYCGTGAIGIYLSSKARRITGMELMQASVEDARNNCRINRVDNCEFIAGNIKGNLASLDRKPDVMIVDPPRAGMHKHVLSQVLDLGPERIVYVSCNPATLARDLAPMAEIYQLAAVQPVDMFPHTHHIETVVRLDRRREMPNGRTGE